MPTYAHSVDNTLAANKDNSVGVSSMSRVSKVAMVPVILVLVCWLIPAVPVGAELPKDKMADQPGGLLARTAVLEKLIGDLRDSHAKEVGRLDQKLADVESQLADANAVINELSVQIKSNRKELYADLGRVVSYVDHPRGGLEREAHKHYDKARNDGYVAGLPNGHISETRVGSIRWMPLDLQGKCDAVAKE